MDKKKQIVMVVTAVALLLGIVVDRVWLALSNNANESNESKPIYWVAPMDPNYRRDEPGKSPMGMDLIPVYKEESEQSDAAGTVRISPVVENNLGVRVEAVKKGSLKLEINTVGYVSFDEQRLLHIHSRVDGWIEKLSITAIGDSVKAGQMLFELYSPQLVYAQNEYLSSLRGGSGGLLHAFTSKLKALGISDRQIAELRRDRKVNQQMAFYAERDGYISELNVREGMFIQPATTVLSIGSLDTVWVIAEIFEHQAGWIEADQAVEMTVNSYPGERWQGLVDYVYPVVNAQTRTLRARIKFENPNHHLKPNMFAQLVIHAGYRDNALSVPSEAVIRDGRMNRVVKALGGGRYRSSRIEIGIESGNRIEVVKGLKAEDKVVVSAQFLIDSESKISADLSRIDGDTHDQSPLPQCVWAKGVIKSIMPGHRMAKIQHEPIVELNWPKMTMDFVFSKQVDLKGLAPEQTIQFCIVRKANKQNLITDIKTKPVTNETNSAQKTDDVELTAHDHASQQTMPEHDHD